MMQMQAIVIVGGGEHACVVADAILAGGLRLLGYLDHERRPPIESRWNLPYLGEDEWLTRHPTIRAVLGIGGTGVSDVRRTAVQRLGIDRERWHAVVHPRAFISAAAILHPGAVVMAGAVVQGGAVIGPHAIVNTAAVVDHDVKIGAFSHVGPGAVVGGGVQIGDNCLIALGSRIRDHIRIGSSALVGMGAVVTRDVPANSCVIGIPAREWKS